MKIFIINDNGNYIILNVDNEIDAENLKLQGAYEVPKTQADKVFGDYKHLVSNENTKATKLNANAYHIEFNLDLEKVLNGEKESKKKEIDLMLSEEIKKGFLYNESIYQIDEKSLNAISTRASLLNDDIAAISWITQDNTIITFTNNEFKDFANQCLAYESDLKIKARVLKNQIDEATTLKQLKALKIGF